MFAALLVLAAPPAAPAYPAAVLKTAAIELKVYRPDMTAGFYRGTRFDHAGVVGAVKVRGHTVFGPWKPTHDPGHNDDIVGPAEEFGMADPLGYAAAEPGEAFLKIGVGELVKPAGEAAYRFYHDYAFAKPGTWDVRVGPGRVTFTQSVTAANGYAYEYVKRVTLTPGQAGFTLSHALTNRGRKPIVTDVYNHNFFNVDADPVGPNYAAEFPHDLAANTLSGRWAELVRLDGRRLTLAGVIDRDHVQARVTGYKPGTDPYRFTLTHRPSGVKLAVTGSGAPLAKMNVWAVAGCLCPEPFVTLDIKPGATAEWAVGYEFE